MGVIVTSGAVLAFAAQGWGQEQSDANTVNTPSANTTESKTKSQALVPNNRYVASDDSMHTGFIGHMSDFVDDQKQIWTSPSRIRLSDANWLVPLGGNHQGRSAVAQGHSQHRPRRA